MKKVVLVAVSLFLCGQVFGEFNEQQEARMMVRGIRPMGMGGAFTAISDDENALFYNPAGISQRQSWLFQFISIDAAFNTQTLKVYNDVMKVLNDENSGSNDGLGVDGLKELSSNVDEKDIDVFVSAPNLLYLSGPWGKNNTFSFGLGAYTFANIGAIVDVEIPDFVFELATISENRPINNADIFNIIPMELLQNFLAQGVTKQQLQDAVLKANETGDWDDVMNLLSEDSKKIIADIESGKTDMTKIVDEITKKINLDSSMQAAAIVDSYVTGLAVLPVSYKFATLPYDVPGQMSVGVNFKYIQRIKARKMIRLSAKDLGSIDENLNTINMAVVKGEGFGIDLGAIYHYDPQLNFGLQISDLFTQIDYNEVIAKYPDSANDGSFTHVSRIMPEINTGAAFTPSKFYYWPGKYFDTRDRFTFALDIRDLGGQYERTFVDRLHFGIEWRYGFLALRTGMNKQYPTAGFGIEFSFFQLSYAYYGEESYLYRALKDESKRVSYHELLLAIKFGHHDGKAFGNDVKRLPQEDIIEVTQEIAPDPLPQPDLFQEQDLTPSVNSNNNFEPPKEPNILEEDDNEKPVNESLWVY
ncbi:MAG: hypothetical protein LBC07_00920 [Elusimicrobiota bacterium]|jgi:hypothetical protein|nr:hypothetical protein [Elusimicrobiota bacterium]